MQKPEFDNSAGNYDQEFTESLIGRAQRKVVWELLERYFPSFDGVNVLELNAGTGEDAYWLSKRGAHVLATDLSSEMVRIAQEKNPEIECKVVDIRLLKETFPTEKFDVIFSNFGGLNCLSEAELKKALEDSKSLLKPGGSFVGVIMPRKCTWETVYFVAKGKFKKAYRRRNRKGTRANLGSTFVQTFYYSPNQMEQWWGKRARAVHPVGFFIPPSYLEPMMQKRPDWLKRCEKWEERIRDKRSRAEKSDHFFIYFQV